MELKTADPAQRRMLILSLSCVILVGALLVCWSMGLFRLPSASPAAGQSGADALQKMGVAAPSESGSPHKKRNTLGGEEP